jgi:hypothetical protein
VVGLSLGLTIIVLTIADLGFDEVIYRSKAIAAALRDELVKSLDDLRR